MQKSLEKVQAGILIQSLIILLGFQSITLSWKQLQKNINRIRPTKKRID